MITKFYLITKDNITTRFMQDADLFEPFKFKGSIIPVKGEIQLPVPEVLKRLNAKTEKDQYTVIGIIVPNQETSIQKGHTVMSDGTHWSMIRDIAKAYNAPITE